MEPDYLFGQHRIIFLPGTRKQIPPAFLFTEPIIRFFPLSFLHTLSVPVFYFPVGSARMGGRICLRPALDTASKFVCTFRIWDGFCFLFCFVGFQGMPLFSKALTSASNTLTASIKKSIMINTKTTVLPYFPSKP